MRNNPDFGLFLGDSGVAAPNDGVSQRMTLTGAHRLPAATKGAMDLTGAPTPENPGRVVIGALCGPGRSEMPGQVARKEKEGENWEYDDLHTRWDRWQGRGDPAVVSADRSSMP